MILLALALQAATPAAPASAPIPPARPRTVAGLRALGITDAGIKTIQRMSAPEADATAFTIRRAAVRERLGAAAAAEPFDVEAFGSALKADAQAEAEARGRTADRIIATLRALSPADRVIYARTVLPTGLAVPTRASASSPARPASPPRR